MVQMGLEINGRNVSVADPIEDLQQLGYIGIPDVFTVNQLARLGILAASVLSQYDYPIRTDRELLLGSDSVPDFDAPRNEHGLRQAGLMHHANGFTQLSARSALSARIFDHVKNGLRIEGYRTADGTRNGNYLFPLCEELAKICLEVGLDKVFDHPESDGSYFMPLFTFYQPGAQVFGAPRELFEHRDGIYDSYILSIQLWPNETPWRIGRNPCDLPDDFHVANHLQKVGGLVVLDNNDEADRKPPLHNPIVTEEGRISVLIILKGEFKERFEDWMQDWKSIHGYQTSPIQAINTRNSVEALGDPFGFKKGPFMVRV